MEIIFTTINAIALLGWSLVLLVLLFQTLFPPAPEWTALFFEASSSSSSRILLIDLLFFLEGICFIEVGRIATGQLKGNLVLGVVLHIIRLSCLLLILPFGLSGDRDILCIMVLFSWALTEVGRYPMYIFQSSSLARSGTEISSFVHHFFIVVYL
jgi:hypothetical protein